MISNLKIAVVGVGGVGGYLAGMLAAHLPEVTVVARGARGKAIEENGLILHSDFKGEIVAHPAVVRSTPELGEQDVIFICVKNYSLEQALDELKIVVRPGTILVPVMNGVDPAERVSKVYPDNPVIDSVIYIVAFANADYSVTQQGAFANLRVGTTDPTPENMAAVETVEQIMHAADLDVSVPKSIESAIWEKYILNCAFNCCTAAYDSNIGPLRSNPETAAEFEAVVREACALAAAKGVKVRDNYAENVIYRFYNKFLETDSSSLQRDVHAGKTAEIDTFCGYVVREGHRLGVPVPVMEKLYGMLTAKE